MHLRRNIRTHPCHRSSSDSSFERDPEQDRWQINELPRCGQYLLLAFWAEVLPTTGLSFRLKIAFLQIYAKKIEIIHKISYTESGRISQIKHRMEV